VTTDPFLTGMQFLTGMPFFHGWAIQTVAALHALMIRKPQRPLMPASRHRRIGKTKRNK
jgi:hypothetical protein